MFCRVLEKIQSRVVSFEEPVTIIRENYAQLLQREENWAKAAQVLSGIDLDSGGGPAAPCAVGNFTSSFLAAGCAFARCANVNVDCNTLLRRHA
jgi:hypothetical protein